MGLDALSLSPSVARSLHRSHLENLAYLDFAFFIVSLGAVMVLYRDAFRFLNPTFARQLAGEALKTAIGESLDRRMAQRLADNLLRTECDRLNITYDLSAYRWGRLNPIECPDEGMVADIHLPRLEALVARISKEHGMSRAVLTAGIGSTVRGDDRALMFVSSGEQADALKKEARNCFRLSQDDPRDDRRAVSQAFGFITEHGIDAIRRGRIHDLELVLDDLVAAIQSTLDHFALFGVRFDADASRQIFPFEWPPLDRPFQEYQRLLEFAAHNGDADILLDILYWPWKVMRLSMDAGDHYFYEQAVNLFPYFYPMSKLDVPSRHRHLLTNRSWTHLREFGGLELAGRFRTASEDSVVDRLASYWKELFNAYVGLLRGALEEPDVELFREAARGFWRAMDLHHLASRLPVTIDLSRRDPIVGPTPAGLDAKKANALLTIADRRDALWFTLGAWLCRLWRNSEVPPDSASELYVILVEPFGDVRRCWRAFATAMRAESTDRLPLSNWEMSKLEPEKVHSVDTAYYLALFFAAAALPLLSVDDSPSIEVLAPLHEVAWVSDHVERALKEIEEAPERWTRLIGEPGREAVRFSRIRALLKAAKEAEEEREREAIKRQSVSADKLAEFKSEFLAEWYVDAMFRRIFASAGGIAYEPNVHPDKRILVISLMLPKGIFVGDPGRTHWMQVGADVGRSVAAGEDDLILKGLRAGAETTLLTRDNVIDVIGAAAQETSSPEGCAIVVGRRWDELQMFYRSSRFTPDYAIESPKHAGIYGLLDETPVYLNHDLDSDEILVLDLARSGKVIQYLYEGDSMFTRFDVQEYSDEEAANRSSGDVSWLPSEARALPQEKIVEYLREHVWLRIEESLAFDADNASGVHRYKVGPA